MERALNGDNPNPMYVPLGKRPEATTLTVRDLLQRVQDGRVRIPAFQRPLRWQNTDVVKLFDSLWRGYPIGSLLFWKRPAEEGALRIGKVELSVPKSNEAWWVVDGQQRITALAAALLELDHQRDRRWSVRFDPNRRGFVPDDPDVDARISPPASALGDLRRLNRWYRDSSVDDAAFERIEDAQPRVLDYAIPAYVVETDDERALRGVFARLNSSGARMRADEVFQALLGADSAAPEALDLVALQERCDLDHFGVPARADVLKAVLAMSGQDPSRRLEDLGTVDLASLVGRDEAEAALVATVDFLQRTCRIPAIRLIPYPVVFWLLARWFFTFPQTVDADAYASVRRKLAAWVWRGAASGAHQRAEVSKMREQASAIRDGDLEGSLDRLMARVGAPAVGVWSLEPFNARNARSRIETLALLALRPADLSGPLPLGELLTGDDRIAREVFAIPAVHDLEEADRRLAKTAANRVILTAMHTGLTKELATWEGWADAPHRALLDTHLIDVEAFEAIATGDPPGFLRRRAKAVAEHVAAFLNERLDLDRPLVHPRESYFEPDTPDLGDFAAWLEEADPAAAALLAGEPSLLEQAQRLVDEAFPRSADEDEGS